MLQRLVPASAVSNCRKLRFASSICRLSCRSIALQRLVPASAVSNCGKLRFASSICRLSCRSIALQRLVPASAVSNCGKLRFASSICRLSCRSIALQRLVPASAVSNCRQAAVAVALRYSDWCPRYLLQKFLTIATAVYAALVAVAFNYATVIDASRCSKQLQESAIWEQHL